MTAQSSMYHGDVSNAGLSPYVSARSNAMPATSLVWSEYCYLICIALALLLAAIPPDWDLPARRTLRHLPLLATLPLVALTLLGRRLSTPLSHQQHAWRPALIALLPLLLLGVWIVIGSAHARVVEQWQATFLNLGLYIAAAPAAALMVTHSNAPTLLSRAYLRLIVITAIVMAFGLAAAFGIRDIYHEQIFLAIPVAVACAIALRNRVHAWTASLFFLALALLSRKNTSYLIALQTVLYMAVFLWLARIERAASLKRLWAHYLAFVATIVVVAVGCYIIYFRERFLPSGNVEFRTFTYQAAWQQFLDSPLWGTSFNAESIRKFTLYTIGIARNRLPTHSDVMDLLANGGLIAMLLWLFNYLRVGMFAYRRVLAPRFLHYPWAAQAHTFAIISVAAVTTYAFNPVLLQPELAFLTWTTLGFLVGLAASCDPELHAGNVAKQLHAGAANRQILVDGFTDANTRRWAQ
jgi:O-antigen ligase